MYNTINAMTGIEKTSFQSKGNGIKNKVRKMFPESKFYSDLHVTINDMRANNASQYEIQSYLTKQHLSTNIFFRAKEKMKYKLNKMVSKLLGD